MHLLNGCLVFKPEPPKDNAQAEVLYNLGLDAFWNAPLDPASLLDISTWTLENQAPIEPKDLPNSFLRRLWLLSPDARSPSCRSPSDVLTNLNKSSEVINGFGEESECVINPLDLVTAVFMSANTFLQQEMAMHMVQCQFALPLVLPSTDPAEPSCFLLWPLRGVVSQWTSHILEENRKVQEGSLASTYMPMVSCVKLGHCGVSKSQVLNHIINGLKPCNETFLHWGMDGGQLPRRLANGLVEIGWYLPTGDTARDHFPVPVVISNLRGDAGTHEKCLSLLCQASSAVIVFCGNLREKEKQILASCKDKACKLILIDVSDTEKNENSVVGFVGSVLQGKDLSEEELANRLCDTMKDLLPDKLKLVTLEEAAKLAVELGLNVDEGTVCKKAMATVEKVLKGLDEGSAQFREKQLPLQGPWWSKLAEIEKDEIKQRKEGKEIDPQLQKEKKDVLPQSQHDPVIELQLYMMSNEREIQHEEITENNVSNGQNGTLSCQERQQYEADSTFSTKQRMCPDDSIEPRVAISSQPFEPEPSALGLEHFLREMGLIFELTQIRPGSGSQNVLRLPSLAADLLLYGVPLELMDGDASNIPIRWLGCVFAELKRRLPHKQCKTRVLTNLGVHHARNAKVLSALFGVKFPEGGKRTTRGVYMVALCLPDTLRKDMECDFLLLIDVEGLCSISQDNKINTQIQDNEMATVATGLSNVLMQNISSPASSEFEKDFTVIVNALLRIKEWGSMPNCQLLIQDEGIDSLLQASQLRRVSEMLQTEIWDRGTNNAYKQNTKTTSCITCVKGPWSNSSLSKPVDTKFSEAVLMLKKNLFGALKQCAARSAATTLPEFMIRLCAIWDAIREESFSVGLQNTEIALAFSMLCTELSQWEASFLENMESWLLGAGKKIFATKEKALDAAIQKNLLIELKDEAREEVKTEVDKLKSKVEAHLMKDDLFKERTETVKPILMSKMDDLRERVTEETIQRLATLNENHCSSIQLQKFETLLETEQESKLHALVENSKSTKVLLQDEQLEEEFEGVWSKTLSTFDFRPSETDDITVRVTDILKQNLIRRGLQKHIKKISQKLTSNFQVYDEHFGYRSRLKHMFEDNNRLQRLEAQQLACSVIEEYHQSVADKSNLPADFSDSYITEMLENVEKALKDKSMEIKSAFEVDLKVYLCSSACQDFQKLHDRFAKDRELLTFITATKNTYLAKFIYQFRKSDQCQRVAQAFTSMVIKPTVLDYIYRPLGKCIVDEIQGKEQQYQSSHSFNRSLLEELMKEDRFESFLEYLLSYDSFRLRKIQETVVSHLSKSTNLEKWRQQRLGEIIGKIAAAVSETAEGTNGVLSDTKPLLERVCLILESDGDVDVTRASLDGPFFSITTEWDCLVTCLMELLAAMRLELAKEFSQNVDITELLHCLPIQPQHFLLNKVRGCDKQCPFCRAPCEAEGIGHEVHRALLHRPKDMLPYDLCSVSSCPESMIQGNTAQNKDTQNTYVKFAKEYKKKPAKIPEEWKKITAEEALDSLKEAFLAKQC
uniref:GTPase, very large interferon inducible 1-like 2 n=1 Tax=Scophthalmus maximus TaxID=52904 RepID=A0A8D3AUK6_SCOMX